MEDRFARLKREIARWIDEEDADLMISTGVSVEVLIASLSEAKLDDDAAGLVRSALLVRRYDLKRQGKGESDDAKTIEAWYRETFPDGVSPDYPYQYLLEEPRKE